MTTERPMTPDSPQASERSEFNHMSAASKMRAAVYGDGDVPRWFNERIAAIQAEARREARADLLGELREQIARTHGPLATSIDLGNLEAVLRLIEGATE